MSRRIAQSNRSPTADLHLHGPACNGIESQLTNAHRRVPKEGQPDGLFDVKLKSLPRRGDLADECAVRFAQEQDRELVHVFEFGRREHLVVQAGALAG